MLGLYPAGGAPISGLLIETPGGTATFDPASLLGFLTVGARELPILSALDLLALDGGYVTDAVMLVEISATDGELTIAAAADLGGYSFGLVPAGVNPLELAVYPLGLVPISVTGGTVALQWSDRDWTSEPDDELPNTHFEGRAGAISFDRSIPVLPSEERRLAGAKVEVLIENTDGEYDGIEQRLAVDGRALEISLLGHRSHAYSARRVLLDGRARPWRADAKALRIPGASQAVDLDVPMLDLFGGTGGADGGDLLKGRARMLCLGLCRGVAPQLVDEGLQIYLLTARAAEEILAVYVRGAEITAGSSHGSYAALAGATVTPGTFDWANTTGGTYIALGSTPDGPVTFDILGDAFGGYVDSHGAMMRRVLTMGGARLASAALASIEGMLPGTAGIVLGMDGDQVTFSEAVSRIATSAWLWWGDAGNGVITVGRLAAPTGSGGSLLSQDNIRGEVEVLDAPPVYWRVTVGYRPNWSPISGADVVSPPTITEERRAELAQGSRNAVTPPNTRRTRNADAKDVTVSTLYDEEADAVALGDNLLSFFAPGRGQWTVPMGLSGLGLQLGQRVRLEWPRYGLAGGRDVRVVGQQLRDRDVALTVIG